MKQARDLKIKNMASLKASKEGNAKEVIRKIINTAEEHKAATYESHDSFFFILAPARTKTFKNEKRALMIAQKIKKILDDHNKLFKQKIEYGISLTYGTIIAKQERDSFKFMSLGNLMAHSKKIASIAKDEILMGENITDKLRTEVKTERHEREGTKVYSVKEIKKDSEENKKFINNFMKKMEREKERR